MPSFVSLPFFHIILLVLNTAPAISQLNTACEFATLYLDNCGLIPELNPHGIVSTRDNPSCLCTDTVGQNFATLFDDLVASCYSYERTAKGLQPAAETLVPWLGGYCAKNGAPYPVGAFPSTMTYPPPLTASFPVQIAPGSYGGGPAYCYTMLGAVAACQSDNNDAALTADAVLNCLCLDAGGAANSAFNNYAAGCEAYIYSSVTNNAQYNSVSVLGIYQGYCNLHWAELSLSGLLSAPSTPPIGTATLTSTSAAMALMTSTASSSSSAMILSSATAPIASKTSGTTVNPTTTALATSTSAISGTNTDSTSAAAAGPSTAASKPSQGTKNAINLLFAIAAVTSAMILSILVL